MTTKIEGIVSIHGKDYATVAYRLELFRADHPDGCIETHLVKDEDGIIVMKALISDDNENLLAADYAEEVRGSSNINKTSALENCSTSAVGRALALAGYNKTGAAVASADEVGVAIARQNRVMDKKITEKQRKAMEEYLAKISNGGTLLQTILDKAKVDHIKELPRDKAVACLSSWEITV